MVAQTIAQSTTQSTARPRTIPVNVYAGRFKVLSSDGSRYYHVDALGGQCDCAAGRQGFVTCRRYLTCRHVRIAEHLWRTTHGYRAMMGKA